MRVLLSTYGSRGDVEPLVGLAVRLRALGAEMRMCAPPDKEFAELLAGVGVPLVPVGPPMGSMVRPAGLPTWGSARPTTVRLRTPSPGLPHSVRP
jgi:vancomycin aglycone glucosyltransferase